MYVKTGIILENNNSWGVTWGGKRGHDAPTGNYVALDEWF